MTFKLAVNWTTPVISEALDTTDRVRVRLLGRLKELLDDYHGVARSLEYYDTVAGIWLGHFTHHVYVAWLESSSGNGKLAEGGFEVPIILDSAHATRLSLTLSWFEHLVAAIHQLKEGVLPGAWSFEADPGSVGGKFHGARGRSWKQSISRIARGWLFGDRRGEGKVLLVGPHIRSGPGTELWLRRKWRDWAVFDGLQGYAHVTPVRPDIAWRMARATEIAGKLNDFPDFALTLLSIYIPQSLLEGFVKFRNQLLGYGLPRPSIVYSSSCLHHNLSAQLLIAEWRGTGTRLFYHQHGGGYGLEPDLMIEDYEIRVSDTFLSWGWTRDGVNVHPMSPSLPRMKAVRRAKTILFNCLDMPRTPYRIMHTPMPGTIEQMHTNGTAFLERLANHKRLVVSPYRFDYGWGANEALHKAAPLAKFDTSSPGMAKYQQYGLVVHNYLGTSWLETLALNVPTVCFYDPQVNLFRPEVQPYIDALNAVGILHQSGERAARFVNSLGLDFSGWWDSADVQSVRESFVARYANFSPDWQLQWERMLYGALMDGV